jgi:putative tricarboxylic transport membrane protein
LTMLMYIPAVNLRLRRAWSGAKRFVFRRSA